MAEIELAELVTELRAELEIALLAGEGQQIGFDVGPVELSLSVQISRETTPGAKVRFWVVEAGADVKLSRASTQQIKLTLTPVDTTNAPPLGHGAVRITGEDVPGER